MSRQAVAAAPARALPDRVPAPLPRPSAPRRVSGPVRRPLTAPRRGTLARVLDAPALERLLRGRVWIAIVGVALLGIVAMQVTILRLGASIGASVTRIQQLEQSNQSAETQIARLQPGGDIATTAAKLGMVYPPAGDLVYLRAGAGQAAIAAASITRPTAPLVSNAPPPALTAPLSNAGAATSTALPAGTGTTVSTAAGTTASTAGTSAGQQTTATTQTPAGTQTGQTTAGSTQAPPPVTPTSTAAGAGGGSTAPGSAAGG